MMIPFFIAAFAAFTTAQCQEVTETVPMGCTTSYSEIDLPTDSPIPTAYFTTTYNYSMTITSTTQDTITVTPGATTSIIGVVNTTTTLTTTVVSVPAATTVETAAGFFPVIKTGLAVAAPTSTATIGRHRRAMVEARTHHIMKLGKRFPETPAGNTVGYIVSDDGDGQDLVRSFPVYVECQVAVNINSTETIVVEGLPVTSTLLPATATALSTQTVTTTETIVSIAPQPTVYAACQANNVVNNVIGDNNQPIFFDRVIFAMDEGFPIANQLTVDTTNPTDCCIACQLTPFCSSSFYAPSRQECHLLLTQAAPTSSAPSLPGASATALPPFPLPSSNTSLPYPNASGAPFPTGNASAAAYPTASGYTTLIPLATAISSSPEAVATASDGNMSILPIFGNPTPGTFDAPGSGTCSAGSMSLFVGKAYGRVGFNPRVALYISNGPCGRMGVDYDEVAPVPPSQLQPTARPAKRMIGMF